MSLFSQSPSFSTRILTPLLSAAWPVPDVYEALVKAFTGAGKTVEEAQAHIEELKEDERYILEVYVILAIPLPSCHADSRLVQLLSNAYRRSRRASRSAIVGSLQPRRASQRSKLEMA